MEKTFTGIYSSSSWDICVLPVSRPSRVRNLINTSTRSLGSFHTLPCCFLTWTCYTHFTRRLQEKIQKMSRDTDSDICSHRQNLQNMWGTCEEHVRSMWGACQEHVRNMSGTREEHVRSMSGTCQEHVRKMSMVKFIKFRGLKTSHVYKGWRHESILDSETMNNNIWRRGGKFLN